MEKTRKFKSLLSSSSSFTLALLFLITFTSVARKVSAATDTLLPGQSLILVGGVVALVVVGSILLWGCRRKLFIARPVHDNSGLVVFSYAHIKNATKNFSEKLGEGGFGCVFKGMLRGSTVVAVKNLKCLRQGEKQFRAEVQTIGLIQHVNLVRLVGFCAESFRRMLVYEYMANGSLSSHLFSKSSAVLSWELRYHIALGVARGLAYLHEECKDCVIHCDMKPDNVLLDAVFCPKIGDFGMAKLLGRDFSRALTTTRGTIGYLAPEWISGLPITQKADVYSYGMMLFEIISGRRNTEKIKEGKYTYFPLYAAAKLNEGDAMCLLDYRLEGTANIEELNRACKVACLCIQDAEDQRPLMGQVVHLLEGVVEIEVPPIPRFLQNLWDIENDCTYSALDLDCPSSPLSLRTSLQGNAQENDGILSTHTSLIQCHVSNTFTVASRESLQIQKQIFCFIAASWSPEQQAGIGFHFHNTTTNFHCCFEGKTSDISSALHAELLGLLLVMHAMKNLGIQQPLIYIDNQMLVQYMESASNCEKGPWRLQCLLSEAFNLKSQIQASVQFVSRIINVKAHRLASSAYHLCAATSSSVKCSNLQHKETLCPFFSTSFEFCQVYDVMPYIVLCYPFGLS